MKLDKVCDTCTLKDTCKRFEGFTFEQRKELSCKEYEAMDYFDYVIYRREVESRQVKPLPKALRKYFKYD